MQIRHRPDSRSIEKANQWRIRHLRLQPWQLFRLCPVFHHTQQERRESLNHRIALQSRDRLNHVQDNREISIQPATRQGGAAGWTAHPHKSLNDELPLLEQVAELLQLL